MTGASLLRMRKKMMNRKRNVLKKKSMHDNI
jgi:hypothetical protein